jgi:hypothetical protein
MAILTFKTNDHGENHVHGVVYDIVPLFGREVHLSMVNKSLKMRF